VGVLADPPAGLGAGPLGQHRPRTDGGRPLGPGPDPAGRLTTAPEALAPPQHHRPATSGQVTHPDRAAAVQLGPLAAAHAADHRGRGLDGELPLATHQLGRDDLEAVQAKQPGGGRTTVLTHLGPPSCRRQTSARYARPQVPFGSLRAVSGTSPRFMTKSRLLMGYSPREVSEYLATHSLSGFHQGFEPRDCFCHLITILQVTLQRTR
jgi:hypothetical protein